MEDKNIGLAIYIVLGLAVLGALLESTTPALADNLYMLGGLGFFVFGIWGASRLRS